MQKFMNQFAALSPALLFQFDCFIYSRGVKALGRTAGLWESKEIGGVHMLLLGENDVKPDHGDKFKFFNEMTGDTNYTDRVTASAAFTLMVVNWFWNLHSEKMGDAANEAFERVYFALKAGVYEDKAAGINTRDFFNITD